MQNKNILITKLQSDFKKLQYVGFEEMTINDLIYVTDVISLPHGAKLSVTFNCHKSLDDNVYYIKLDREPLNPFEKPTFKTLKSYDSLKSYLSGFLNEYVPLDHFRNNRDYLTDARRRIICMLDHSKVLFSGHQVMLPISDIEDHWDMAFKTFKMTICVDYDHPEVVRFKVDGEIIDGWDNLKQKFKDLEVLNDKESISTL